MLSPSSSPRTDSPSFKRKGRSTSVANNKERIYRYASLLEKMEVSPREREWIHDSLIHGDEQMVDAMEQFTMNQNIATVRRALRGRHSPSLTTPVDHLLVDFSTLEMESPATVHAYDRQVNPFVTAALDMSPPPSSSEMEGNPFLQFSPTTSESGNSTRHRRRQSSPAKSSSPAQRPSLVFGEATLNENAPSGFLHSIQERMTPPPTTSTRPELSFLSSSSSTISSSSPPQWFSVAALLDHVIPVSSDFEQSYQMGRILGSGKYSVVRTCHHLETHQQYAVKVMDKHQMMEIRFLKRELEIMYGLHHDGIVQLIELFESSETIYIVMELCSQELFEYIDRMGPLEETTAQRLIKRLVSTVAFLHSKSIVHRDIKPENILIRGTQVWDIKLTDFGIARRLDGTNHTLTPHESLSEVATSATTTNGLVRNRTTRAHTKCGTRDYIAPEVMSGKGYGTEADLWSVGVVTYVLLSGCAPVFLPTSNGTKKVFFSEECWSSHSDEVRHFIESLLVRNPEERSTAEEALQHPWLSHIEY